MCYRIFCLVELYIFGQESGLKVNHPASFAVRLNGAQGKMEAKVHSPSGALEECVVTELEKGLCLFRFLKRHVATRFKNKKPQSRCLNSLCLLRRMVSSDSVRNKFICSVHQTNTQSDSSPGKTVSIPLMSSSTALISQEVLSRSELGSQDRPEMPV